ncbi:unnamed protein product, partial [Polarella glacialis]
SGCLIPKTEHGGITLQQLRALVGYVVKHCDADHWTSSNSNGPVVDLRPADVNLYELVHWVVKPATRARRCSYVELVASCSQLPIFFVTHWWGEQVQDFLACLSQHAEDRALGPDSPYWVCAYANNQWALGSEVGDDPVQTSFFKAMSLAQGAVVVLDRNAVTYSRVWCVYEAYVALYEPLFNGKTYLYDIYTCAQDEMGCRVAVGITDGCAAADQTKHEYFWKDDKFAREKSFPLQLVTRALEIKVQQASTTREMDRIHILNSIVGSEDLNAIPPEEHDRYEVLNNLLRGHFAASVWRIALECGCELGHLSAALRTSGLKTLQLSFDGCQAFDVPAMTRLAGALPLDATCLDLDFFGRQLVGNEGAEVLGKGLSHLKQLTNLQINFQANQVGDQGAAALGEGIGELHQLVDLQLDLAENQVGSRGAEALGVGLGRLEQLSSLKLDLDNNQVADAGGKALCEGLGRLLQLSNLHLDLNGSRLGPEAAKVLGLSLRQLRQLVSLFLDLPYNQLGDEGAEALGQSFCQLEKLTDLQLELRCNQIGDKGAQAIGEGLGSLENLGHLMLSLSHNEVGDAGAQKIGEGLRRLQKLSKLQLDLKVNQVGDVGAAGLMSSDLSQQLTSLELDLVHNQIGNAGAEALAAALSCLGRLGDLQLHLSENCMGDEAAEVLGRGIGELRQLTVLQLDAGSRTSRTLCPTARWATRALRRLVAESSRAAGPLASVTF